MRYTVELPYPQSCYALWKTVYNVTIVVQVYTDQFLWEWEHFR